MSEVFDLLSIGYTSRAAAPMSADDVYALYRSAAANNAIEGITGLLVFNGERFFQVIEGATPAIEAMIARIAADTRHTDMVIHENRGIPARAFPGWDMKLIVVDKGVLAARGDVEERLPEAVTVETRDLLRAMTAEISVAQ